MHIRLAAALFCMLSTAAVAQTPAQTPAPSNVSGKWTVHIDIMGNTHDFDCKFEQKEKVLGGSCSEESGFAGTVDGDQVNWQMAGAEASLKFSGKLNTDGTISGSVNVVEYAVDGDFKATPVK